LTDSHEAGRRNLPGNTNGRPRRSVRP
jgi:hypothetical protein